MTAALQWLNSNRYRVYPFSEDLVLTYAHDSSSATVTLENDVLLDVQCLSYVLGTGGMTLASISAVTGSGTELSAVFQVGGITICTMIVPETAAFPYTQTVYTANGQVTATFGEGVPELITELKATGVGEVFEWNGAAEQIEPALVAIQDQHHVTSLIGDTGDSVTVDGDVYWEEGYNLRILIQPGGRRLRLVAEPGAGAGKSCDPVDLTRLTMDDVLIAINELHADGTGRIQLRGGNGLQFISDPPNNQILVKTAVEAEDIDC